MKNFMDKQLINLKCKWNCMVENVKNDLNEERGASDMVAVILLIVVVVGLAIVFRKELGDLVTEVMGKVRDFVEGE